MTTSRHLALPLSAALLLAGCSAELDPIPVGGDVSCSSTADCPSGTTCSPGLRRCVPLAADDRTPPALVAGSFAVSPALSNGSAPVTVSFTVSEALANLPVIRFQGATFPLNDRQVPSRSGLTYTLEFTPTSADGAGPLAFELHLVDPSGNAADVVPEERLTLDFSLPTPEAPVITPDRARVGSTLQVSVKFDEPLGGPPALTLGATGPTLTGVATQPADTWVFTRTLDGSEPAGPVDLHLAAVDLAGNERFSTFSSAATLDFTPPAVATSTIHTPQVRAGDTFVGVVRFDEPLGDAPVVRLVPVLGGLPIPVVASAIDATTWALSREIPAGEPDGDFELTLVSGADRAGNPLASGPLGPVTLDSTAPNVVALTVDHANATYRATDTVVVTFDARETLPAPPVVRLETLPRPRAFTCTGLAGDIWRCSVALDGNERPESVVSVSVTATDAAGNVATAATSVVLDFTPPALLAGAPGRAAFPAGGRVTYLASVSEPLASAPQLTVSRSGTVVPSFFGAPASESATTFSWFRPVPTGADGAYAVDVSLVDEAGNAAGPFTATGFEVDTALPSVVGAVTLAPAKAAFAAGDRPSATFTVSEDLPVPTARLGTATPIDATCLAGAQARTFTCTLDRALAATDGPEGASALLITLSDAAGNVGYGSKALVLDYTPPALASAGTTQLIPGPGNLRTSISAVGDSSTLRLTLTSAEPLQATPAVVAFDAANGFQRSLSLVSQSGTTYVFDFTTGGTAYPAATWQARWDPIDLAGNRWPAGARPVVASFQVDGEAPPAPTVGLPDAPMIVWHRTPWGTDADAADTFRLAGGPTSVIGGDLVVAWDGPAPSGREIARGPASVDGFDLTLPSDPPDLWLSTVDGAGNEGARTRVIDVVWTASLAGKVPGSTFKNPHRLERRNFSTRALFQADSVQVDVLELGVAGDGLQVTTAGASALRPVSDLTSPVGRRYYGFTADPGRGVLVLFGGQTQGAGAPGDTWEWDGSAWRRIIPEDPEGDGNPPALDGTPMAYDPVNGLVVMQSSNLWGWNGRSWRNIDVKLPDPPPGYHASGSMAWDAGRGVLVLFGGGYANDTWEWNGTTWDKKTTSGDPGLPEARAYHQLAYDSARRRVVLYGGLSLGGTGPLDDLWSWDGTAWTQLTGVVGSPGGRAMHAMAYDPNRQELVVQGGFTAGSLKDGKTWVLRSVGGIPTWSDVTPSTGAMVFAEHQATWDQRSNSVLLFGDWSAPALRRWEGSFNPAWTPLAPGDPEGDGNPTYSSFINQADMTYVPGRGVTVYHEASLRQTWEWNRASWARKVSGAGVPQRTSATMGGWGVWSILFGGSLFGSSLGDTWGWDGTSWTQLTPSIPRPVAGVHSNLLRQEAALVTDPNSGRLYRFGGADQASFGIRCFSDIWEWIGGGWVLVGGESWNDPEGDGSPLPYGVGVPTGEPATCNPARFTTWDPVNKTMLVLAGFTLWEWNPLTNSWLRRDFLNGAGPRFPQAFFYDNALRSAVALDETGAWAPDLITNTWVQLPYANPYGMTKPAAAIFSYDPFLAEAVGLELAPFTWSAGTQGGPAHLFTVDFSRANGPDPGLCVNRAACPIQRIDVRWTGGASSPETVGGALQAWTGDWTATTGTDGTPAAPKLMTWSWLPTSPFPASSLFHGQAKELTFQVVPPAPSTAAGTSQVATDAVSVTIHYRRP